MTCFRRHDARLQYGNALARALAQLLDNASAVHKAPHHGHFASFEVRIRPTMSPYRPSASAKISTSTMLTYSFGCSADARTPESPTTPIASPADIVARPHAIPLARCEYPVNAL